MFDVGACLAVSKNNGIYRVIENGMETSAFVEKFKRFRVLSLSPLVWLQMD